MPSSIITNNNGNSSSSSSSSIRFMGLLKQPDSDPVNNLNLLEEFDENDVLWSESSDSTNSFSPPTSSPMRLHLPPPQQQRAAVIPATLYKSNSGLSAALSVDHHPLVRRKSTLNRSAAKMIPPTAAVVFRSENSGPFPKFHQSAPVNVPVWQKKNDGPFDRFDDDEHEQQQLDGDSDEVMIPPHVMVAQSHVTFSVFEGVGRTLKGRDLRRVRNAVFQQTGFID